MVNAATLGPEAAILDILADEDDDLHIGEALTVLLNVVAGICCEDRNPHELAIEFGVRLGRHVSDEVDRQHRVLS
ncbi:hypothetical protein [Mesorhizobium sp. J428]|uniref:hypothetical protein n=1 Tax=Mesorhizobium sp. J428 TaxID=2898440 RepID=UPI002151507A|nr:hypothetical protein [Mesorhizobium sp. J428]MCR5855968.1 hypothetical protein [Mesorhizobium sp. J428]